MRFSIWEDRLENEGWELFGELLRVENGRQRLFLWKEVYVGKSSGQSVVGVSCVGWAGWLTAQVHDGIEKP